MTGMNMTLLPVRTSRISGKALDAEGKPLVGGMVMAMERSGAMFMTVRSLGQIRPDGSFTVSGITPGNYILRVGLPGMGDETAIANVTVTDGDVNDVQLIAGKAAAISGRVLVDSGATPPTASSLRLFLSSSEPMAGGGQATVKDDFTFEMRSSPGHYLIRAFAGPNSDWHLHAVRHNGLDVTDSGIEVPAMGGSVRRRRRDHVEADRRHRQGARRERTAGAGCVGRHLRAGCAALADADAVHRRRAPQSEQRLHRAGPGRRILRRRADRRRAGRVERSRLSRAAARSRDARDSRRRREHPGRSQVVEVNMTRHLTLANDQPRTRRSRSRLISACSAAFAVALVCAVVATPANAQPPGFLAQQPGVPQMPGPGGRQQPPNAAADQPPGTATLRGHVFDAANGQALRKAQVRIIAGDGSAIRVFCRGPSGAKTGW